VIITTYHKNISTHQASYNYSAGGGPRYVTPSPVISVQWITIRPRSSGCGAPHLTLFRHTWSPPG